MHEVYVSNYAFGMMLRASLDLLWRHISWPPQKEDALTMTEWGPFYLSGTNAPYPTTFIRAADRSLYHATNAWRNLAADLAIVRQMPHTLPSDAKLQTNDRATKYDIEAFLGAIVAITDENLIGIDAKDKHNRLGKSQALGDQLIRQIRAAAEDFRKLGADSKWRAIRNSAYHLNPGMTDWGASAQICKIGDRHIVELEGVHYVNGASTDLVNLFTDSFGGFVNYVVIVRDLLLQFAFHRIAIPRNKTFASIRDPLGNMIVGLGKDGYELRHFPQTASDFVGPLKG